MPPNVPVLQNVHVLQSPASRELIESLRDRIASLEGARRPREKKPISSGCEGLDQILPDHGFHRGTLVEWLASGEGCSAESLVFATAREAWRAGGAVVVCDQAQQFYPPAAVRLGIKPEGMIVVQAASDADNLWALDQALRCPGVAAAVAWPEKLDPRTFRRLQLAAEQGGGLGLLVRPARAKSEPSWAEIRLAIEPMPTTEPHGPRRLRIQLLRSRGGPTGAVAEVEIEHETHPLPCVSPGPSPAACRRAAGA